jgi:hypothetical protein
MDREGDQPYDCNFCVGAHRWAQESLWYIVHGAVGNTRAFIEFNIVVKSKYP